jgi:hypothetical protein
MVYLLLPVYSPGATIAMERSPGLDHRLRMELGNQQGRERLYSCVMSSLLEDMGKDFAADAELTRLLARHNATGGCQDSDAQTTQDNRQLAGVGVDSQTRLRDTLQILDDRRTAVTGYLRVSQGNFQAILRGIRNDFVLDDETFRLKNAENFPLDFAIRRFHCVVIGGLRITDARQ